MTTLRFDVSDMVRMQTMLGDLRGHVRGARRNFFDQVGSDLVERIRTDMVTEVFPGHTQPISHEGGYASALRHVVTESDDDVSLSVEIDPSSRAADYWADVEFGQVWTSFDQFAEIEEWAYTKFGGDDAGNIIQSIYAKFLDKEPSIPQPLLSQYMVIDRSGQVSNMSPLGQTIVQGHFEDFSRSISYFIREYRHAGARLAYAIRDPRGRFTSAQGLVPPEELRGKRGGFSAFTDVSKSVIGQGRRFGFK